MFHTCAIKGSGYRPVMASRHGQPCGATGPVRQVPAAGQKHLSLGTGVGGLALGSKHFTVRRFSPRFWPVTVVSRTRRTRL